MRPLRAARKRRALLDRAKAALAASRQPKARRAQAQHLALEAEDIVTAIERDRSWGVHGPAFTLGKVKQAKLLAEGAIDLAGAKEAKKVSIR